MQARGGSITRARAGGGARAERRDERGPPSAARREHEPGAGCPGEQGDASRLSSRSRRERGRRASPAVRTAAKRRDDRADTEVAPGTGERCAARRDPRPDAHARLDASAAPGRPGGGTGHDARAGDSAVREPWQLTLRISRSVTQRLGVPENPSTVDDTPRARQSPRHTPVTTSTRYRRGASGFRVARSAEARVAASASADAAVPGAIVAMFRRAEALAQRPPATASR